jgi:cytochrome c biogenesis protein CcdA
VLGLSIIAQRARAKQINVSSPVFWTLLGVSFLYLLVIYAALYTGVFVYRNDNWDHILRASSWVLILLQVVFLGANTALFTERP